MKKKVCVVGAGRWGLNHIRTLHGLNALGAVVESDSEQQEKIKVEFPNLSIYSNIHESFKGSCDGYTIATPVETHYDIAKTILEQGKHLLVEKPLAIDPEQVQTLIQAADASNVVLQVGHIERFNPAVRQLEVLLQGQQVLVANARRMSAVRARVGDIDVVMDLMVHDLDVILYLMGTRVENTNAVGVDGPHGFDHVTALLSFDGGPMASLTASRITQNQIRKLEVTTKEDFFSVDYSNQELLIFRQGRLDNDDMAEGRYVLDVDTRRVFVRRTEPLVSELEHFVGAIRGDHENEVDGRQALNALNLVWDIQEKLSCSTPGS